MECPYCGNKLDSGFNCPKCKAKSYEETVSEYNTNGEKIYEKNTVKLVQPDPTPKEMLWWLVENCKDIKICNYDKTLYFNGHKIWNQEFYFDGTDYNNLTEAINEAYNKAREAQNERD